MSDAKRQIAFDELGLAGLLRRYRLQVPPNQREYSWTEREVTQLLQDFAKAVNEDGPYFLGTIVTIPRAEDVLEVVDGQQRLATTAILLAAIRDYLKERNEDLLVQSVDEDFLSGIDREKRVRVPKLRLNLDDNDLFNRLITSAAGDPDPIPIRTSHERLLLARDEAQKHVRRVVAPLDEREHGDLLNRWLTFLEHRAKVVLLKVPDDADAYKMFETLNDRGLRTSQADLVKNFLFSRANERIGEVQSRWSYMRGALESASDDSEITITFLRHALIVQRGYLREVDVYDTVQDLVKSEQSAVTFAVTLESLANVYVATFNPESEHWNAYPDAARRSVEVFNLFDIKPMRALIVGIASKLDVKEASVSFKFLVALGVRLIIASSTRTSSVEKPLADAAKAVFDGSIKSAGALVASLASLTPTDAEFTSAFEKARASNARLARYYLRSLELAAKDEAEPWFVPQGDKQVINLEHVLPKKPQGNWPQFSEDVIRQYSTRLGNLALLRASDNSDLKSLPFEEKKRVYASSPYVLTSEIATVGDWTVATIDERQRRLGALAVKTWPSKA